MKRTQRPSLLCLLVLIMACAHTSRHTTPAQTLYHEGQALLSEGRPEAARAKFTASLALSGKQNDTKGTAHNLNEIGILHTQAKKFEEARACFQEAEALYRQLSMDAEVSKCLNNRALTFVLEKDYTQALATYEELIAWDETTGNRLGRAITYTNLGTVHETRLNAPEAALEAYEQAFDLLNVLGDATRSEAVRERLERLQNPRPTSNE